MSQIEVQETLIERGRVYTISIGDSPTSRVPHSPEKRADGSENYGFMRPRDAKSAPPLFISSRTKTFGIRRSYRSAPDLQRSSAPQRQCHLRSPALACPADAVQPIAQDGTAGSAIQTRVGEWV